ncbi:MAG TPA: TonB-dependent receptor [Allosphingosinicella sp.]|nr:TonB-dependent receptor [Allosphingosinicella sp.]
MKKSNRAPSAARIMLLGCAAALSAPAWAGHEEDIVVTGERIEQAGKEVEERPGGADLVTAEEYDERVAVSLREALAFSPGVYSQPRYGQEVRLSIRGSGISRGFHQRGLTLLQDGIPINLADDNGDFQELDPLIFQYIQVFRGANGLRFGSSTLGGAINGVTPTGRTAPRLSARVDGGSFETLRGLVSAGFETETGDAWFAVTGDRSDGEREHSRRRSLRFHGNVGVRISPNVETRFYASAQTIEQEIPGALPLATVLTRPRTGNFVGDQARDIDSLRLQNRTLITLGDVTLAVGGFVNAKELYHPIFQVVDQQSLDKGGFAHLDWESGPIAVSAGLQARFGGIDSRRFVNVNGVRGARTIEADQKARTINAYGEGRYRLGALSLIGGGIYTHGKRDQDQIFPAIVSGRAGFDEFSPRFGLLWEPRSDLHVYANYSRSHELPGFGELAQVAAFVPLDAQRAWTAEIGARGRIGIASFDLSLYRARIDGEMLQFTVGPDIPAATFNADETLHQGIEAGLDLRLSRWARLRQVYQLNDFRFRDDRQYGDNRLPVVPKHLYRAELRLGPEGWGIAPSLEWVPEGAWADYANTLKVDGYVLVGLTAEARVSESIELFLDARNLTNEKAVGDISAVIDFSRLAPAQRSVFFPVERRAVFGGLRARF